MATLLDQVEPSADPPSADPRTAIAGRNPWALAARRLRRNRIALAALVLFVLIVVLSLLAPLYAEHIAHVNALAPNLNGTTVVGGKTVPVMQEGGGTLHLGETPISPTRPLRASGLPATSCTTPIVSASVRSVSSPRASPCGSGTATKKPIRASASASRTTAGWSRPIGSLVVVATSGDGP